MFELILVLLGFGSTKKTTTTSAKQNAISTNTYSNKIDYDPRALEAYRAFLPQIQDTLSAYASDPDKNAFFNKRLAQALDFNRNLAQRDISGIMQRNRALGMTNSPALSSQIARAGRAASSRDAAAHGNLLLSFEDMRRNAINAMMGFQPLQLGTSGTSTGTQNSTSNSTSVEKTSGAGTWLPQLISGGIGLATGFMGGGGGLGSMFGSKAAGGAGGFASAANPMAAAAGTGNPFYQPNYGFGALPSTNFWGR